MKTAVSKSDEWQTDPRLMAKIRARWTITLDRRRLEKQDETRVARRRMTKWQSRKMKWKPRWLE